VGVRKDRCMYENELVKRCIQMLLRIVKEQDAARDTRGAV